MSSVWVAIALTITATVVTRFGLVFVKRGIEARALAWWLGGMGLLASGIGIYMAANALGSAPISLLQPIYASGWIVLAVLAVKFLHERFQVREWLGLAAIFAGVMLLCASVGKGHREDVIHLVRLLAFWGILLVAGLIMLALLLSRSNLANREVLFGTLAGVLTGVGYLSVKVCPLALHHNQLGLFFLGLAGMGVGLLGGLAVAQWGFREGRALVIASVDLVVNQVLVVVGGIWCLGEHMPEEMFPFYARIVGFVAVLSGTLVLARFDSARAAMASGR